MISLLYHSRSAIDPEPIGYFREMAFLLTQCFDENLKNGITGVLTLSRGRFMQVLEGSETAVDATFVRIAKDHRHGDVRLVSRKPIAQRRFVAWSMAFVGPPIDASPAFDMLAAAGEQGPVPHDDVVAFLGAHTAV